MTLPATTDGLQFGADSQEEALAAARAVGGEIGAEDRESGTSVSFPIYSVVGSNARDAKFEEEVNGKIKKLTREGWFRLTKDGENSYFEDPIFPFVILTCRTGQVLFEGGNVLCRGISTNGRQNPVCIAHDSPVQSFGGKCSECQMFRFNPIYRDKSIIPVNPRTNDAFKPEEWCKSSCDLYAWKLDAEEGSEIVKIQFSATSFPYWTKFSRAVENRGVKLWTFWTGIRALEVKSDDPNRSASYVPEFASIKPNMVLNAEQVAKAEKLRSDLLARLTSLIGPHAYEEAAPPRLVAGPAGDAALPAGEPVGAAAGASRGRSRKGAAGDDRWSDED